MYAGKLDSREKAQERKGEELSWRFRQSLDVVLIGRRKMYFQVDCSDKFVSIMSLIFLIFT